MSNNERIETWKKGKLKKIYSQKKGKERVATEYWK